jgi:hypothetical protein
MSAYYMNEASFDLPDVGYVDRTVTHLEGKAPSGIIVALMVERSPFSGEKTLREAAEAHMNATRKRLRGYTLLLDREGEVAGVPAVEMAARWRDSAGYVYSRQAHLVLGGALLLVAGETAMEEQAFCDAYVEHVIASLRPLT